MSQKKKNWVRQIFYLRKIFWVRKNCHLPSEVIFHQRLSDIKGHLPSNEGSLPKKIQDLEESHLLEYLPHIFITFAWINTRPFCIFNYRYFLGVVKTKCSVAPSIIRHWGELLVLSHSRAHALSCSQAYRLTCIHFPGSGTFASFVS